MRPIVLRTDDASGDPVYSPVCPLDLRLVPFQVTVSCLIQGTVTYSVEWTNDDIWAPGYDPLTGNWNAMTDLSAENAAATGTLISPVRAIRLAQTAGNGSVEATVLQAGW